MIASCAVDVKFHDWESCDCLGSVQAPDTKAKGFLDISWCNEGKHVAAVPISGKSLVISTYQTSTSTSNCKDDRWRPAKDIIDLAGVKCVCFSKVDNPNVVVGTVSGEVMLYSITHKRVMQSFADLPAAVNQIEYGAQNQFVAAGCANGQIFLYATGHSVNSTFFVPGSDKLTAIAVHSRTPHLMSGGSDKGIVALWDIVSGCNILRSENHSGAVLDMSFSTSDESFTTIGSDRRINIYDLRTRDCVHDKLFDIDLTALAYCPNGNDIAVATARGQIICLDKRYLHSCKSGLKAHKCAIKKISFETSNMSASYSSMDYSKSSVEVDIMDDDVPQPPIVSNLELSKAIVSGGGIDKCSIATSRCQMAQMTTGDRTTFHIIDENSLNQLRTDITRATKEIVTNLVETMNNEFLKMRMGVSREFCSMEIRNKKRWNEFNMVLLKIADFEDQDSGDPSVTQKDLMLNTVKSKLSSNQFLTRNNSSKSVK